LNSSCFGTKGDVVGVGDEMFCGGSNEAVAFLRDEADFFDVVAASFFADLLSDLEADADC